MVQLTEGVARVAGWGQERWLGGQNQDSWLRALRLQGGLVESRWRSFENIWASSLPPGQWCRRDQALGETSYHEIPPLLRQTISQNYFVSHSLLPRLCLDTGCDDVMGGCRIIQTGALPTSLYTSAKVYTTQLSKCLLWKGLNSNQCIRSVFWFSTEK